MLTLMMITVRREMSLRLKDGGNAGAVVPGRLRVINPGTDPKAHPGELVNLRLDTSLGADPENDVILGDQFISRRHARLRWDGITWWIEDLGSRNGTYVNGLQITPGTPKPAPSGARIFIGDMAFELVE
ncbi:MAG: FHA domain-containing protein [Chloroflexota bacterium]|nr:MAG: FHA domain-containing protein [Chloroflexota bacterium]